MAHFLPTARNMLHEQFASLFGETTVRKAYASLDCCVADCNSTYCTPANLTLKNFCFDYQSDFIDSPTRPPKLFYCDLTFQMATVPSDLFLSLKPKA